MTNEQFAYWLQGYAEICGTEPTAEQWQIIKDHLQTVFVKSRQCGKLVGHLSNSKLARHYVPNV